MSGPTTIQPWPGRFVDPGLEDQFLRAEMPGMVRQVRWTASLGSAVYAISGIPEWLGATSREGLWRQLVPRLVVVLLAPLVVWSVHRARSPRALEVWTRGFAAAVGLAFLTSGFGSVASYEAVFLALLGYALIAILVLPLDPRWALVVSGLPIIAFLVGVGALGAVPFADRLDIGLVGAISLGLAVFTSARLRVARRQAFATLLQERRTRRVAERLGQDFVRLFDSNPSPLVITSPTGGVLRINDTVRRLLEIPDGQRLERLQALDFYRDEADRRRFIEQLRRDGAVRMDAVMRTTRGNLLDATLEAYPTEYEGQAALVTCIMDRTEERRIARDLRQARD